jgi:hypothetical membrane protein
MNEAAQTVRRKEKLSALCGIIAPIFFSLMVIVESLLRPGYSQVSNYISDLGVGQFAILQNINFWAFGILVFIFALGFGTYFARSRAVTVALSIFAWMIFLAGLFPTAPYPYPGNVHNAVSQIAFLSVMASEFLVWRRLRGFKNHKERATMRPYGYYSLASGLVSIVCYFLLFIFAGGNPPIFVGLFQRLFLGVIWVWIVVLALKLLRTSQYQKTAHISSSSR